MTWKLGTATQKATIRAITSALVLSGLLAACGGGGGGATIAAPGAGATSVGGGAGSPGAPGTGGSATPSLKEKIAELERSGAYPALDRSSDIAGPDINGNGVRDDIEAWINSQQATDGQRKALLQKARSLQRTLVTDLTDKSALQAAGEGLAASSNCGAIQFPEYSTFSKLARNIEAMTANTRARAERYMKYNAARSGSSTTLPNSNTCEP